MNIGDLIFFGLALSPILLGIVAGGMVARAHCRALNQREEELADIIAVDLEALPGGEAAGRSGRMVLGQVVLGCDHFRVLIGALGNLIGGEVRTFTRLHERARREALVRLKQDAKQLGFDTVLNVRFDTTSIGSAKGVAVEVLASGTGVVRRR